MLLSANKQLKENNIRALDIAKRLIDMGYHPPTIYFPKLKQFKKCHLAD